MDAKRKTMVTRLAAAAAGLTAAMFVGMMYPNSGKNTEPAAVSGSVSGKAVSASATVDKTVSQKSAPAEKLEFIEYRKADISEYQMSAVSSVPLTVYSSNDAAADESSKAEEEKEKEPEPLNIEDFSVVLPEDGTEVYNIKTEPQNFSATRSVADEYYTVKDLISGGLVTMNAHDMLCMMVYNEIGAGWDEEAIKAQIVAAYNHLRYNDSIGHIPTIALKPGYPAKIEKCVMQVEGQCVYYEGSIINAAYAASTAGYSADSGVIFGVSYPYLKPVVSEYDDQDPNWGSFKSISEEDVRKAVESRCGIVLSDDCTNWFTVDSIHAGRYVGDISIDGGRAWLTGAEMRTLLKLKSSAFEISYSGGVFTFKTYGYGHGVGMSQWGAKLYADAGWTYDQILRHYYVNTVIGLSEENARAVQRGYEPPPQQTFTPAEDDTAQSEIVDFHEDVTPASEQEKEPVKAPEPEPVKEAEPEPQPQPEPEPQPVPDVTENENTEQTEKAPDEALSADE